MTIFRFIYSSRATLDFGHADLIALCETASRRNQENLISGLLLYDGARFLQAIEGPHEAVHATMDRIKQDKRHREITFAFADGIAAREFPSWSMEQSFGLGEDIDSFLGKVKTDVSAVSDPRIRAQFIGFARLAACSKRRF